MALEKLNKSDLIAQLKQWQSEALVRMMSPATKHDERVYFDGMVTAFGNALKLIGGTKGDGTDDR